MQKKNGFVPQKTLDTSLTALEDSVQGLGRNLLAEVRVQETKGRLSDVFYNRLMELSTRDEKLKVELFRFVDALPALKTAESVARHLAEYLIRPDIQLPPGGNQLIQFLGSNYLARLTLKTATGIGATTMAKRFIAGRNGKEATAAIERLRGQNLTFTMDLLGEAVTSEHEAFAYQKKYLDLLDDLAAASRRWSRRPQTDEASWGPIPMVNVSVKLSSLYARFDPMARDATTEIVIDRLLPIVRSAKEKGFIINFDMEQNDFRDVTFHIFKTLFMMEEFRTWDNAGVVCQAYLKSAEQDLEDLRDYAISRGTPFWVRLVKGAYWDYETIISAQRGHPCPVWPHKPLTDACFERCEDFLIENWMHMRPAIASHNVRSQARAQAKAQMLGLPPRTVEYQVLYGMGEPMGRALVAHGERVRVYVPFGELLPGMAYLVRRLLENSSNDSFIRKAGEDVTEAQLLASPHTFVMPPRTGVSQDHAIDEEDSMTPFFNEPEADFAQVDVQTAMRNALQSIEADLGAVVPVIINGVEVPNRNIVLREDPSQKGVVVARVTYATTEDVDMALTLTTQAFQTWRDVPVITRAAVLRRTADGMRANRFVLSAWMVREVGKPWREADADVAEAIDFCDYYAAEMERLAQPRKRNIPGEWNSYFYESRGPAVIIAPWNFPLAILTGMAVAALVAGNPVILKPAEQSSRIAYELYKLLIAAGCPVDVVQFLPGDGEVIGPKLVSDPRTAIIAFTGSRPVGLAIIKSAADVHPGQREIKRVIAELGGKNAIIVDEDADLDEAVLGVLHSAIGFSGQKCSACSRVLVIGTAYEPFCERLAEAIKTVKIGPAIDPATTMPPVVDAESQARVLRFAAMAKASGQLLGEQPVPEGLAGNYVPVTVAKDCDPNGPLCQDEVFGPVLAVMHVATLDEALDIADNTIYALTGGLYSRSPNNIERVRKEMRVGNLYINRKITGAVVDRQPFGGARLSGVGSKAGGPDYLLQFLVPRTITESVMRRGFAPTED